MPDDFKRILVALAAEDVRHLVVGGMAVIEYGGASFTQDLDLCYERSDDNLKRLAKVLIALKASLRGAPEGLPFKPDAPTLKAGLNFTLTTEAGSLDVLGELAGVGGYEELIPRASTAKIYGVKVRVIGLEDLIRAKRAAGRPKDKLHLLELEELRKLKKRS